MNWKIVGLPERRLFQPAQGNSPIVPWSIQPFQFYALKACNTIMMITAKKKDLALAENSSV
jgi:hypothetical protein